MRIMLCALAAASLTAPALANEPKPAAPAAKPHAAPKPAARPAPAKAKEPAEKNEHESGPSGGGHWGYGGPNGPAGWANMNPAYSLCRDGKEQSPINITSVVGQKIDKIEFSYGISKINLVNNGHTIQANYDPGSYITAFGERYQLLQFHFHTPSEEQINGRAFPLVAHLVHRSEDGRLAVIGVLFEKGRDNPTLEALWDRMPTEHGETRQYEETHVSAASLLPLKLGFYTFMGSLTTPPCSEGVRWIVMKNPQQISERQLARFRQEFPMNARPIQPINTRLVVESQ
ncbi:carbonic anhydrase [Parachitinimonas caeni]|uniref:carbonic anhydrase n=1 Tax=Parachitinimonas caeni TaxID=3031301 RepID=A0ABT7DX38_9NEIS|nr:carbonic anhydrase family protein [Parachitinimonas caeni]MDK2124639.1 carbonic anhydrase family protein [Parachitinimonas caeni]